MAAEVVVGRKNQFFLPGDGVDREVIQSDICRYLDNDATVRPGDYNGTQGYYIYAYRNLTSEQVKDIKLDSEKLQRERRERANRRRGGHNTSSSSAPVPYKTSKTHDQMVQRLEERERKRGRSPSPPPAVQRHNMPAGIPTPMPAANDYPYPGPVAPLAFPQPSRPIDNFTPPSTTPESQFSQPSVDSRSSYENRGYQDGYRPDPYPQYPNAAPQFANGVPGLGHSGYGRGYEGPRPPQMHSGVPNRYDDYDEPMDTRQDDYAPGRMETRLDRSDIRLDPRDNRMGNAMSRDGPASRVDPRGAARMDSARPHDTHGDNRDTRGYSDTRGRYAPYAGSGRGRG